MELDTHLDAYSDEFSDHAGMPIHEGADRAVSTRMRRAKPKPTVLKQPVVTSKGRLAKGKTRSSIFARKEKFRKKTDDMREQEASTMNAVELIPGESIDAGDTGDNPSLPSTTAMHRKVIQLSKQLAIEQRTNKRLLSQLEQSLWPERIQTLENEIAFKNKQLKELHNEMKTMKQAHRVHKLEIADLERSQGDYPERFRKIIKELRQVRERYHEASVARSDEQRKLRKAHEQVVKLKKQNEKLQSILKSTNGYSLDPSKSGVEDSKSSSSAVENSYHQSLIHIKSHKRTIERQQRAIEELRVNLSSQEKEIAAKDDLIVNYKATIELLRSKLEDSQNTQGFWRPSSAASNARNSGVAHSAALAENEFKYSNVDEAKIYEDGVMETTIDRETTHLEEPSVHQSDRVKSDENLRLEAAESKSLTNSPLNSTESIFELGGNESERDYEEDFE